MPRRDVVLLPDAGLSTPCRRVGRVDDAVRAVCVDLVDTMRAVSHSVGVAAPQIGIDLRIFCVDVTGHRKTRSCHGEVVLIDPEIVSAEGRERAREGCMSVPDLTGDVDRATGLIVRGVDPDGARRVLEVDAFEARAVQHELDHLDGLVFVDRVPGPEHLHRRRTYR